jgi:hypothetical protein
MDGKESAFSKLKRRLKGRDFASYAYEIEKEINEGLRPE